MDEDENDVLGERDDGGGGALAVLGTREREALEAETKLWTLIRGLECSGALMP